MELPLLLLLAFTFLIFLYIMQKPSLRSKSRSVSPPGPMRLPIIGSLHHLIGQLPHHSLRDLSRKHGPLMHLQLGEIPMLIVSSPETAKEFLKTHDLSFATRPQSVSLSIMTYGFSDIALAPYGDSWRQLRKICTLQFLSNKRVESFRSLREEEVSKFIDSIRLASDSPINITKRLQTLTSDMVSRAAFGSKGDWEEKFLAATKEAIRLTGGFDLLDLFPSSKLVAAFFGSKSKLEKVHGQIDGMLDKIIEEHRQRRSLMVIDGKEYEDRDLTDVLLRLQKSEELDIPLTDRNIKAVILELFSAGTDTSSSLMIWAMTELVRNPNAMAKAQEEIRGSLKGKKITEADIHDQHHLKLVIKETLRLHSPFPLLVPRECRQNCHINGYEISKGTRVLVNAWAMQRDARYWGDDAEEFRPERFLGTSIDFRGSNFEFIPFGAGRRICPGLSFGIANVELALAQLLYHFNWKLPDELRPEEVDMSEEFGVVVTRKEDLNLIAIPILTGKC